MFWIVSIFPSIAYFFHPAIMGVCVCHAASPGFPALHFQAGLANKIPRRKKKRNPGHLFSYFSHYQPQFELGCVCLPEIRGWKIILFIPMVLSVWSGEDSGCQRLPNSYASLFLFPLSMPLPWYWAPVLNSLQSPVVMHHLLSTWSLIDTKYLFYAISIISAVEFSKDSVYTLRVLIFFWSVRLDFCS